VTLSCDARSLDARLHRAVVTFRTDAGLNRSLTVDVKVLHGQPYVRFFEAEAASATGAVLVAEDGAASGGRYVHVPSASAPGVLTFTFDAPAAGDYYVLGRFYTPPDRLGGFLFSMDRAKPRRWVDQSRRACSWLWDLLRPHEYKGDRTVHRGFQLSKGTHTFTLTSRRPGARLDCLVVSNQPYVPNPRR